MQGVLSEHPPGAVCMISGDITRYAVSMHALQSLKAPVGSVLTWNMGVLIARSINDAFATVMSKPELQWAWIMGDDHTYEPDTLLKLLDRQKDIIVPLCLSRMPPMDPTIIAAEKRLKYLEEIPITGLYRLEDGETCGDAGILIRRSAMEKLGPPWYERKGSGAHDAEDQEFIDKIKRTGFDVFVDMDIAIGHVGFVEFMPVRKNGHWEVRMIGAGNRHIVDLGSLKRNSAKAVAA